VVLAYLALGILVLVCGLALLRWFVTANPRTLARAIKAALIAAGVLGAVLLLASGRGPILLMLAPLVFILMPRWRAMVRRYAGGAPPPGQTSDVATRYFRMVLDHDSGTLSGEVTRGRLAGRSLGELGLPDLLELLEECADDPQSVSVLQAYLDRAHPDWRSTAGGGAGGAENGAPPHQAGMTVDEARAILGVGPEATEEEIKQAHRALMQKVHPDRGGSTYLAAQINRAKDVLLGE